MNDLKVFKNENFGEVRTITVNNQAWFVASDVCNVLDIKNATQAVCKLDEDERSMFNIGRQGKANIINEYGLYSLILSSRKPEAKQFKKWITHEVIPSIRNHGIYATESTIETILNDPDTMIKTLTALKEEREKVKQMQPKAHQFDTFLSASNAQTMNEVAKSIGIGRNILFEKLRQIGILMANNTPRQEFMNREYFKVIEKPISMGGKTFNKPQTLVTAKGISYIVKRLSKEGLINNEA